MEDKNGDPLYIVAKYGNMTKLTLGHYCGMDTCICTNLEEESREVIVHNYSKTSGDFLDHGDSGSLIFNGASVTSQITCVFFGFFACDKSMTSAQVDNFD